MRLPRSRRAVAGRTPEPGKQKDVNLDKEGAEREKQVTCNKGEERWQWEKLEAGW